jgi:SurA N-terminal domain
MKHDWRTMGKWLDAPVARRWSMHAAKLGVLIVCGMFVFDTPARAVLVDKILAVVNGETLTWQDFEDHLALGEIYQPHAAEVDRQEAFQRFVDQALLRQEASRTRIVQVGEAEINQYLRELEQQTERGKGLVRVMQERGLSRHDVRAWLRHQLIVRAFIDRRVRLFIHVPESQIVQYYQDHQPAISKPLNDAVREQIRRLLTERQVNVRLAELIEGLRRKGNLDFPP